MASNYERLGTSADGGLFDEDEEEDDARENHSETHVRKKCHAKYEALVNAEPFTRHFPRWIHLQPLDGRVKDL